MIIKFLLFIFTLFLLAFLMVFVGFLIYCLLNFDNSEKLKNGKDKIINFILKVISDFLNFAFEMSLIIIGQYKRYKETEFYNNNLNNLTTEFNRLIRLNYEENDFLKVLTNFYMDDKIFYFYFKNKLSEEDRVKEVIRTCFYQATNNFEIETFSKIYLNYEGYYQLDLLYDTTDNVQRRRYNLKSEQDKKDEYDKNEILGA